MNERTQREEIASYLRSGKSLTSLEALQKFGCFRLPARILELKQRGWDIQKYMTPVGSGKRVAAYFEIRKTAA